MGIAATAAKGSRLLGRLGRCFVAAWLIFISPIVFVIGGLFGGILLQPLGIPVSITGAVICGLGSFVGLAALFVAVIGPRRAEDQWPKNTKIAIGGAAIAAFIAFTVLAGLTIGQRPL